MAYSSYIVGLWRTWATYPDSNFKSEEEKGGKGDDRKDIKREERERGGERE